MVATQFVQDDWRSSDEWQTVFGIGQSLLDHLNTPEAQLLLEAANIPGQSSSVVQNSFLVFASELGFVDESKGLFEAYENSLLRPDYYRPVGDTGILMEVERGKTTTNNMDFLDFWKCHLCESANYLFLMVPQELRHNPAMRPKREYNSVVKRMSSFFIGRNYTNVRGLWIFGY